MNMKTSIVNIISIAFLTCVTYFVFYYSGPTGGLNWWGDIFPYVQFVSTVLLMLVGIVFGCLFRQVRSNSQQRLSISSELDVMWHSVSFWSAILVSPLVFGGVFFVGQENPSGNAALFLAFQNGFFCESIFNTMFKNESNKPITENA